MKEAPPLTETHLWFGVMCTVASKQGRGFEARGAKVEVVAMALMAATSSDDGGYSDGDRRRPRAWPTVAGVDETCLVGVTCGGEGKARVDGFG